MSAGRICTEEAARSGAGSALAALPNRHDGPEGARVETPEPRMVGLNGA